MDDGGVGVGAGQGQGAGALGGDGDGQAGAGPADLGMVAAVLGGLPGEEVAEGLDVVAQIGQPGGMQSEVQDGAVAGADAQEGAAAGKFVDGGDGGGGDRRVAG